MNDYPKILVISDYRSTNSARPEAEALIGLSRKGFPITVMTHEEAEYVSKFKNAGIRVIPFYPEKKRDHGEVAVIRKELIDGGYDILQLFTGRAIVNGIAAAKGLPVKVVLYRGYTGNVHWYDPTAYFKYLHPRVDKIICLTDSVKQHIDRNLFFDSRKTVTILKGHKPEWYQQVQPADLSKYGIPENAFTVVSVGNVRRFKGIPYFIRASYFLPPGLPIHFLMVGRGMDAPYLKKLIDKSPYRDNFHFTGFIEDPLPVVKASQTLVLASLGGEAINKSVIEAMSLGLPPVITDIAGNKDLQMPEAKQLVVPVKDPASIANAILYLFQHPTERELLGEKAREHIIRNLHNNQTVENMAKLYTNIAR